MYFYKIYFGVNSYLVLDYFSARAGTNTFPDAVVAQIVGARNLDRQKKLNTLLVSIKTRKTLHGKPQTARTRGFAELA
jgi:hypothetical protein